MSSHKKFLVTGNAGFVGFHVARHLLQRGDDVVGFDVVNDYYDTALKRARLDELSAVAERSAGEHGNSYVFIEKDLANRAAVDECFDLGIDRVIHLAAQAGVRYSLVNPYAYVESNIIAYTNILEACRHNSVEHLTYASTSSVYGANTSMPFSEHQGVDHPLQFYAATKRANELMAHSYSHLFGLPTTGLRFFTVYGPWGRPDMALFVFTKSIIADVPIDVFNHGKHTRDFTFIDDIVEGVVRASDNVAAPNPDWDSANPDPASSSAPYRIYNIGNNHPVQLLAYISAIEHELGKKATRNLLPLQPGDVPDTYADVSALETAVGYKPGTSVESGVHQFINWYKAYYGS